MGTEYRMYFPGRKRTCHEINQLPPSNPEMKNEWTITLHPLYACMVWTGVTLRFHINHTVLQTRKCNSTDAHNKTIVFAAPIFTKVVPVQQHYMQISCTKFHLNQTRNIENRAGINLWPSVKYRLRVLIFMKLVTAHLYYFLMSGFQVHIVTISL